MIQKFDQFLYAYIDFYHNDCESVERNWGFNFSPF